MSALERIRLEAAQSPQERNKRPSIRRLCALMAVSTSDFYHWCRRPRRENGQQDVLDERLVVKLRAIEEEVDWTCGSRWLRHELRSVGEVVGRTKECGVELPQPWQLA